MAAGDTNIWLGTASATAQVWTITFSGGPWTGSSNVTTTMTGEDGQTATVVTAITASWTDEQARDAHLSDLQASTNSLFTPLAFTSSSTDKILCTARVSGVPFSIGTGDDDGTGTAVAAVTTANSGPHDWQTAANWDQASVPVTGEHVKINQGSSSILYGLDNLSGVPVNLRSLRISKGFKGNVGQVVTGIHLAINVNDTGASNVPVCTVQTGGNAVLLEGGITTMYVTKLNGGANALQLGQDTDIDDLFILGNEVGGTITLSGSTTIDKIYCLGCPGLIMNGGSSIASLDEVHVNAGKVELDSAVQASGVVNVWGGELTLTADFSAGGGGTEIELHVRGGVLKLNGGGTIDRLRVWTGEANLTENEADALTISDTIVYQGTLDDRSAQANITYTGGIVTHVPQNVYTDHGQTVTPS